MGCLMVDPSFDTAIEQERNFILRRAVERLREGVFDPFAVRCSPPTKISWFVPLSRGFLLQGRILPLTSASAETMARENPTALRICRKTL